MKTPSNLKDAAQQALKPLQAAGVQPLAILPTKTKDWVVTTHHEVEGVHFDPTFLSPHDLGHKSLTVALFRLAAHGIDPYSAQVTVGVNQSTTERFLDEVFRGMKKAADANAIKLSFGTSAHSPTAFFLALTLLAKKSAVVAAPKSGDCIAVTGSLGSATAGLHCLRRFGWPAVTDYPALVRAHLNPQPPLEACLDLHGSKLVTSFGPLIEGLSSDCHRLNQEYGVGVWLDEKAFPVTDAAKEAARLVNLNARQWALFGSDDFGLILTVAPKKLEALRKQFLREGLHLTVIGEIRPENFGVKMRNLEGEEIKIANRSWNPIVRRKAR